jgi:hypothetical protein
LVVHRGHADSVRRVGASRRRSASGDEITVSAATASRRPNLVDVWPCDPRVGIAVRVSGLELGQRNANARDVNSRFTTPISSTRGCSIAFALSLALLVDGTDQLVGSEDPEVREKQVILERLDVIEENRILGWEVRRRGKPSLLVNESSIKTPKGLGCNDYVKFQFVQSLRCAAPSVEPRCLHGGTTV